MATRTMHAKRRSAPKGKGGSSGGGNPRNDGRITETQHEDAMRVLRAEYYQGVRTLAEEVSNLVKNEGMDEGDALHQTVDGSYWVIYTHANFQVLMCSDHHDAYSEEYGEAPVSGSDINWAALAFATLSRDVSEQVSAGVEEGLGEARKPQRTVWKGRGSDRLMYDIKHAPGGGYAVWHHDKNYGSGGDRYVGLFASLAAAKNSIGAH